MFKVSNKDPTQHKITSSSLEIKALEKYAADFTTNFEHVNPYTEAYAEHSQTSRMEFLNLSSVFGSVFNALLLQGRK